MDRDFNELNEQMRREIRERADIFLHDAVTLADKYLAREGEARDQAAVANIAAMLANQYSAEIVSMAMREVAQEAADVTRNIRLYTSTGRKAG
ncbi:hypothetical protein [Rubrimonas sp.]|uniref:hypothetical protein n=1 Tax=Rubrimonas sp. TaxID=2036015 RepID=UPI002FDEAC12